tara:strand:+ start:336 stop:572 length:237 start_codon:yes stop_codon:yes gene_type:complete
MTSKRKVKVYLTPPMERLEYTPFKGKIGWGDRLELFFNKTKLNLLAVFYEKATGKSCGCAGRKKKLNRLGRIVLGKNK